MGICKALFALAVAFHAFPGALSQEATTTLTVTVTPAAPPDVVVNRTLTRSVYTARTTVPTYLNCTTSVFARPAPPPTTATPTSSPTSPVVDVSTSQLLPRQDNVTATVTATVTAPARPARTRTAYIVETQTQSGAQTFSRYQCVATIAYLYTTDASTTVSVTQTSYATTITATSRITCAGFPGGGLPVAKTEQPALPSETVSTAILPRQESPTPSSPATSLTPLGTLTTNIVHLTRTAYTVVRFNATGSTVAVTYECSPTVYDTVTVARTRTAWPSTVTVVSSVVCTGRGTQAEIQPRQTSSPTTTPAPTISDPGAIHRTRTVYPTVTVTEASATTRIIINCAPSSPPTTTSTSSVPPSSTPP
ncbi:hypothetical protein JX266_010952 [Neoarthrinium moseri]|nr:hypothetical protein JX266_010952 [Neoarthrinium moseri]